MQLNQSRTMDSRLPRSAQLPHPVKQYNTTYPFSQTIQNNQQRAVYSLKWSSIELLRLSIYFFSSQPSFHSQTIREKGSNQKQQNNLDNSWWFSSVV